MKRLKLLLLPLVLCGALLSSSLGSVDSARTTRLFHKLESLPSDAPFATVNKLVLDLIRRDTINAYRYFRTGFLWVESGANPSFQISGALLLGRNATEVVKNSSLSMGDKNRITKAINRLLDPGYPSHPPASPSPSPSSPTPTPSPTP